MGAEIPLVLDITILLPLPPLRVMLLLVARVVNEPVLAVVPPIAPGLANVAPVRELAFKLGTLVVLAMTRGAVPVATVLVITPLAPILVNNPVLAVVPPIAPGLAKVAPPNKLAFKLETLVVLAIISGAVPLATVEVITPLAPILVNNPEPALTLPMDPGLANVAPPSKDAFKLATTVVLDIISGVVPLATVEVI